MSPLLIVLLVWSLALAGADRYDDYAGVSMPHYNMEERSRDAVPPPEDYIDRSPDAPLPFDYKYEEELQDKENRLPIKVEEDNWQDPSNKLKEHPNEVVSPDDDELHNPEVESVLSPKASRKNRRHRSRIKNKEIDREETSYRKKAASKARSRRIDKDAVDIRNDYFASKGRKREDNSIESDDANFRETTEKIIRRKPRDRRINLKRLHVDDEDDDEFKTLERDDTEHFVRDDDAEYPMNRKANARRFMVERPPRPIPEKTKLRNKNYPEYDDSYYDMKRVNNMKNKLPDLLRRTQASTMETLRVRPVQDFTYRRANLPESSTETPTKTTSTESTITTKTITVTEVTSSKIASNSTELSLAEKSRLSILKKAQRKEDVKDVARTTKPPVLMQVTSRMQTLVMVEPPQADVRLRSREVFDDSPERIAKAKKLMRRKLVAGARSIHDLTDNWDEMICDYIDVSLLDGSASICLNFELLLLSLISFKYWSFMFNMNF